MSAVALTPALVERPPVTELGSIRLPADRHPVAVYLASHAPNSRLAVDAWRFFTPWLRP
jgi:hypothetical protein